MVSMARKVTIQWLPARRSHPAGWIAIFPSGRSRRWVYRTNITFSDWVMSFLRGDGDVVEVKYPKTIVTYTKKSRPRRRDE